MTVFEILNQRYEYEELMRELNVKPTRKQGTTENIKWFLSTVPKRKPTDLINKAVEIGNSLLAEVKN